MSPRLAPAVVVLAIAPLAALVVACDEQTVRWPPPMADIAIGDVHSCAISRDGEAYCWGDGSWGQLGTGTAASHGYAVRTYPHEPFTSITAGGVHTCALAEDGAAHCWGANYAGQAGVTGNDRVSLPAPIGTSVRFTAISAGSAHTCGIDLEGAAHCWGDNAFGQLGTGSLGASAPAPAPVATPLRFRAISAGGYHTCAIATTGEAYCWGANSVAQLGAGTVGDPVPSPVAVDADFTFEDIAAGLVHSCGVRTGGDAYCWGQNRSGEIGNYVTGEEPGALRPEPIIAFGERFTRITAGHSYTCGLQDQRELKCWGRGVEGQLGSGQMVNTGVRQLVLPEPGRVPRFDRGSYAAVAAGGATHVCALTVEGYPLCWGQGDQGQLGTGDWFTMVPHRVLLSEP
jgi:alpha-tubulin suppressor-like RCC1 family protein